MAARPVRKAVPRRRFFVLLTLVLLVVAGGASLREGPVPRVEVTALRTLAPVSRGTGRQSLIGGGRRIGWGTSAHYRLNTDWKTAGPELDRELKALGFTRASALRPNGGHWERADLVVFAQTHWTKATGNRLSDLYLTRPALPGEIVRGWVRARLLERSILKHPMP